MGLRLVGVRVGNGHGFHELTRIEQEIGVETELRRVAGDFERGGKTSAGGSESEIRLKYPAVPARRPAET